MAISQDEYYNGLVQLFATVSDIKTQLANNAVMLEQINNNLVYLNDKINKLNVKISSVETTAKTIEEKRPGRPKKTLNE